MAAPDEAVDLLGQVVVVARRSLRGPKSERDGHIGAAALLTLAAVFKDIAPGTGGGADDTTNDNGNIDPQIDNASDYRINVDAYGADVTLTKQVRALREFEGKLLKGYQEYIGLLETSGEARDGGGGGGGGGAVFEFTLFRSLLFFLPSLSLFAGAFTKPAPRAAAAARGLIVAKCAALLAGPLRHFNYAYELMQLLVSAAAGAAQRAAIGLTTTTTKRTTPPTLRFGVFFSPLFSFDGAPQAGTRARGASRATASPAFCAKTASIRRRPPWLG